MFLKIDFHNNPGFDKGNSNASLTVTERDVHFFVSLFFCLFNI